MKAALICMILKNFVVGPLENNTYLIYCDSTKRGVLIDPAFGSYEKVIPFLEKEKIQLEAILLTHSHWDHIGNVKKIKDKTGAKLYIHKADSKNLNNPGTDKIPSFEKIEGVKEDSFLKDGDKIKVGNIEIEVIHTPGHTPGSVCYYIEKENILISGDTLFAGSMGNINSPTAVADFMWDSLKRLSKLPPKTKVYPGHGPSTTIGKESWLANAKEIYGY